MKKIILSERAVPAVECGCGRAADDPAHKHDISGGHGCCGEAAGHGNPAHQHEKGCCGGSHARETSRNRDGLSGADEGKGAHQ